MLRPAVVALAFEEMCVHCMQVHKKFAHKILEMCANDNK